MTAPGHVAFLLHAHLPFVRHPEHDDFLEERWLFEAITECYLPLLDVLAGLERDHVPARLTLSFSPTLLAMLADELLQVRYARHLDRCLDLAEREIARTRHDPALHALATLYRDRFAAARERVRDVWHGDLLAGFRGLQDAGQLELITTAATHALLPLLRPTGQRRVQLEIAAQEYRRFFGRDAAGMWLPECAYDPALDADLLAAGFRYAVVDAHGLTRATPRAVHGVYAPIVTPGGLALFGRDPASATQVWSAVDGYPGDPAYRDFHRDIGFDLPDADMVAFRPPGAPRIASGIKYHRITGPTADKSLYDPAAAMLRVRAHADHFVQARTAQLAALAAEMDQPPVVVCPYDAELFGHWWFEGPAWLDAVMRRMNAPHGVSTTTLLGALDRHPVLQSTTPSPSTWGQNGHYEVWVSEQTDWVYGPLHAAGERLQSLCRRFPSADPRTRRALTQALRELLLAQASDWPFMMSRATTATYAEERVRNHLAACTALCDGVDGDATDDGLLTSLEARDNLFPALDYRIVL